MINLLLSLNIIFCDIKGSVKNPGVYEINNNNIYEVINLAGGLNKDANISYINLSKKVTDEMVIYIPSIKEKPKTCPPCKCLEIVCPKEVKTTNKTTTIINTTKPLITTTVPITTKLAVININQATKEELMTLNGIGEKTAEKIIEYRLENPFLIIEDIMNVKGVGELVFAKIKSFITV